MAGSYWNRKARRFSRRRMIQGSAAGVVGAGALVAIGCGDDDDDDGDDAVDPTATSAPDATEAPQATATSEPAAAGPTDGSFYSALGTVGATTLDPHRELYRGNGAQLSQAYDNLLGWEDVDNAVIRGEIASGLPEQPDEVTYQFTIRNDVNFQNKGLPGGRAFTMDDVRFNIDRQATKKLVNGEEVTNFYRNSTIYSNVDSVDYTDDTHFTITLKSPDATWLGTFCDEFNAMVAPEIAEQIEDPDTFGVFDPDLIVGTGAYIFDAYDLVNGAHAVRNDDYFLKKAGEEVAFFDELYYTVLPSDVAPRRAAFEQKQLDIYSAPLDVVEAVMAAQPDVQRNDVANPNMNLEFAYNWSSGPAFSNPALRKAIHMAVDRTTVAEQQFQGLAKPNAPIPWAFSAWAIPQEELATYPGYRPNKDEDIAEARALWNANGGPDMDPKYLEFVIVDSRDQTIKEWFPAMLNENLDTDKFAIKSIPVSTLLEYNRSGQGSVGYLGGWDQWTSPDPRGRFAQVHTLAGNINFWAYSTPEMETVMENAFKEFDTAAAIDLMRDAQIIALNDAGGGHIHMVGSLVLYMRWPYLHREGPQFINNERRLHFKSWIDQNDPTFAGRGQL